MATANVPNSRPQNISPQTDGRHHGHFFRTIYRSWTLFTVYDRRRDLGLMSDSLVLTMWLKPSLVTIETQAGNKTVATMINTLGEYVQWHMHFIVVSWFHSTLDSCPRPHTVVPLMTGKIQAWGRREQQRAKVKVIRGEEQWRLRGKECDTKSDNRERKGKACVVGKKQRPKEGKKINNKAGLFLFCSFHCAWKHNICVTCDRGQISGSGHFQLQCEYSQREHSGWEAMRRRDWRIREARSGRQSHHVEVRADLHSSGQVPHDAIPVMTRWEKDSWIEGVRLQNKHLVLMTLLLDDINGEITAPQEMKKGRKKPHPREET